ncbi:MAG TPA: phosphoheptose isomerase [Acidimicrobiaceae bacterium]|nr:phosphoheptose isomerase [Acidimicrobiaceae bacterium]HCV33377.1 phosphoheptose isomerase [Acidimicrobiaceae bacterium]
MHVSSCPSWRRSHGRGLTARHFAARRTWHGGARPVITLGIWEEAQGDGEVSEEDYFNRYFTVLAAAIDDVVHDELRRLGEMFRTAAKVGGKVILAGNGGSAAMASHVSVDLTKAAGIRAVNFNEADLLTCFANDFGYENWVARALEAYADPSDLVVLVSSSGASPNMVRGAEQARAMGLGLACLTGFAKDNPMRGLGDVDLWVDSDAYNIVEMTHHVWLLAVVDHLIDHGG